MVIRERTFSGVQNARQERTKEERPRGRNLWNCSSRTAWAQRAPPFRTRSQRRRQCLKPVWRCGGRHARCVAVGHRGATSVDGMIADRGEKIRRVLGLVATTIILVLGGTPEVATVPVDTPSGPQRPCPCDHTAQTPAVRSWRSSCRCRWRTPCPRLSINRPARSKYISLVRHPY